MQKITVGGTKPLEDTMNSNETFPKTHNFETDVYYETLNDLRDYLGEGIEHVIKPFPRESVWGCLRRWWAVFLLPFLFTGLFVAFWMSGLAATISPLLASLLPLTQAPIEQTNVNLLTMIWLMKLCQIPVALFGGWLSIGNGKRWRKRAMLMLFVILLFIFVTPPGPISTPLPSLTPLVYAIVIGFVGWILTVANYGLGIQAGQFLSLIAEIWYPFRKVVPAAGGRPVPEVTSRAYQFLQSWLADKADVKADLSYISASAQAHLDVSETMSLPWGILIAVFSLKFVTDVVPAFLNDLVQMFLFVGILCVALGIFFIAYHASLQVCIIQATAQLQRDLEGIRTPLETLSPVTRKPALRSFLRWLRGKR